MFPKVPSGHNRRRNGAEDEPDPPAPDAEPAGDAEPIGDAEPVGQP